VDVVMGGRTLHLAITVVPLDHPRADVLVQVEDQTDAILSEARLRKQENLVQLGTLAATVAHELRNPLAGISGALQVLSRGFEPGDRRAEVMKKVMTQVHGLDALVSDLLAFVRPKDPRREPVALHEVVAQVVENAALQFGNIRIGCSGDGTAQGDTEMVRQILLNLVINGCQAAGEGGEVWIDVAGDSVTVSDSGPGISPEAKERLFEPFFTTRTHGTGLGLPNSMLLAQAMGARLLVLDSGPLRGATFQLVLRPLSTPVGSR
jgi:two-component system sensor histidine kinase PilS (NtrC family)